MKYKVCGMRDPGNLRELERTGVDFAGFIFYEGSARAVDPEGPVPVTSLTKVGVFVNADEAFVEHVIQKWKLPMVQLHGDETPEFCGRIRENGVKVVKAFNVGSDFDFQATIPYEGKTDFFLFDAKGKYYGGNSKVFDWKILERYTGGTPFWLSGGIRPGMAEEVRGFYHPRHYLWDFNSGFETEPGLKNIDAIQNFMNEIRD